MLERPPPPQLRFGDFELDLRAYELRRRGRVVRLERLAMDLLLLLRSEIRPPLGSGRVSGG